jgi:HNH endonuclease
LRNSNSVPVVVKEGVFKPSKNPQVLELTKSHRKRSINLGTLRAIRLPELNIKGKPKRMCCWCTEGELFSNAQKYCSESCSSSAMAWAYPQKEDAIYFILERQNWKCNGCQYQYVKNVGRKFRIIRKLKHSVPKERKPEVDHIIPISKGGPSIGIDGCQILCYSCHKAKTKIDNSGLRKR